MYALITGASSGIGLELAYLLAQDKVNLILVARSKEKLSQIASDLQSKYNITVYVFDIDLSEPDAAEKVHSFSSSNKLFVNYLINNAGFGDFGEFVDSDLHKVRQMMYLNMNTLTELCYRYLQDMKNNKQGKILNVASTAAFQPGPLMAVYYATKAYVLHFTEALDNELRKYNISATALCPGATESGFQELAAMENSRLVKGRKLPSSKEVAKYGYQAMLTGKTVAIHGFTNYIMAQSVRFTPRAWVVKIARWIQEKV